MFRRRWSGLPADPVFPADLKTLGYALLISTSIEYQCIHTYSRHSYFVNDDDEIRSIDDPNNYFKFFICKNERWNERQRFAMNGTLVSSNSLYASLAVAHEPHCATFPSRAMLILSDK